MSATKNPQCRQSEGLRGVRTFSAKIALFTLLTVTTFVVGAIALPSAPAIELQKLGKQQEARYSAAHQIPIGAGNENGENKLSSNRRKLHGRFLHITDVHPDPHYASGASPWNACHVHIDTDSDLSPSKRKKGDDGDGGGGSNDGDDDGSKLAGKYGAPTTSCDSPQSLVNATFDWIKKEFMRDDLKQGEGIDFVIWTGDSARHDNDVQRPRTWEEILGLNTMVVEKMKEVFGDKEGLKDSNPYNDYKIPIVPTIGNNDIMPHNIFLPGPTIITREYLHLWRSFIPEDQYHVFDRGAYFWKEVIPGNSPNSDPETSKASSPASNAPEKLHHGGLAVISLNSMYFFSSNSAVDGCDLHTEPGYEQFEWLRHQLQLMRDTGMKAILIGHVPPARVREVGWREGGKEDWEVGWRKRSWDETCWRKWVSWNQQYRDVIAGSIFGHMNLDHFMVLDTEELKRDHKPGKKKGKGEKKGGEMEAESARDARKPKESERRRYKDKIFYPSTEVLAASENSIYKPGFTSFRTHPTILMTQDNPLCSTDEEPDQLMSITSAEDYLQSLRESFKRLVVQVSESGDDTGPYKSKIGGKHAERFVVNIVGPSIVPNYFPTLRIMEYNTSGLVDDEGYLITARDNQVDLKQARLPPNMAIDELLSHGRPSPDEVDKEIARIPQFVKDLKRQKEMKGKTPKKPADPIPDPPPESALPGPGHTNQPFTLLGYIQYYANLTRINDAAAKMATSIDRRGNSGISHDMEGDGDFYYEVEYNTRNDDVYKLKDLTVGSYLKLARRLVSASRENKDYKNGNSKEGEKEDYEAHSDSDAELDTMKKKKKNKKKKKKHSRNGVKKRDWIWREFLNRAFVGTASTEELDSMVRYNADD